MADYRNNPNNIRLAKIIKHLGLTKPGSKIVSATDYDKGNVSSFINNKKPVPDTVIERLYRYYNLSDVEVQKVLISSSDASNNQSIETDADDISVIEPYELFNRTNTNGNFFEKLQNGKWLLKVQMIPYKFQARYISQYCDGEMIEGYPEVTFFVDKYGHGNYKGMEITNDSMDDGTKYGTPAGAIALGRELGRHLWKDGFYPTDYGWGIVTNEGFVFKDISAYDNTTGEITCHSRNDSYEDFQLNLNDVLQIFKVITRQF